jgi:hypothetical protein
MRRPGVPLTLLGLAAAMLVGLGAQVARSPLQPAHPDMAKVVAITAHVGRFHGDLDFVDLHNARGVGQFSMPDSEVRCDVGDLVPVEQRGTTLSPAAKTCR